MAVSYACGDLPGMKPCPAQFTTETADELWEHITLHAKNAHKMDTSTLPGDVREKINSLFRYYSADES